MMLTTMMMKKIIMCRGRVPVCTGVRLPARHKGQLWLRPSDTFRPSQDTFPRHICSRRAQKFIVKRLGIHKKPFHYCLIHSTSSISAMQSATKSLCNVLMAKNREVCNSSIIVQTSWQLGRLVVCHKVANLRNSLPAFQIFVHHHHHHPLHHHQQCYDDDDGADDDLKSK